MIIGSPCPYICDNKSPLSGYCNSTACINPKYNCSGTYQKVMVEFHECPYCHKTFPQIDIGNLDPQKFMEAIATVVEILNNGELTKES